MVKLETYGAPGNGPSRRAFVVGLGSVLLGVASDVPGNELVRAWDHLLGREDPALPSGRASHDPRDWLGELFGNRDYYSALPGRDNIDFRNHPDIVDPFAEIMPLWNNVESADEADLCLPNLASDLVLIGGPVSNGVARHWQGYQQSPTSGVLQFTDSQVTRRWRFEYDLGEPKESGAARFVGGALHRSWPQAILDTQQGRLLRARLHGSDRLLLEDWLLISFVPNPGGMDRGTSIFDASDLHGQGNKVLGKLLRSPERLQELLKAVDSAGLRPNRHFQALYRVDVEHPDGISTVRDYHLVGVDGAGLRSGGTG